MDAHIVIAVRPRPCRPGRAGPGPVVDTLDGVEHIWAPWRMEYVGGGARDQACILCAIPIDGHDQARHVVERSEHVYVVLNRFPYTSGHLMVVPYRHAAHITDVDEVEAAALMAGARRAIRALDSALSPQGFNIGINHGRAAGAGIDAHVHMHVVPRWSGDTNFMPVLEGTQVIPDHLDRTAERLRPAFAAL